MTDWPKCVRCGVAEVTEHKLYQPLKLCFACGKLDAKEKAEEKKVVYKTKKKIAAQVEEEEAKEKVKAKAPKIRKILYKDEYRFIPRHMRWCAMNPSLTIHDDDMTRRDVRAEKEYVKNEGEPGPLASNLYSLLKGNEKALEGFFNKIMHLAEAHEKKRESREKTEDAKQVDNIRKLIKSSMKEKGVVERARQQGRLPQRRVNKK